MHMDGLTESKNLLDVAILKLCSYDMNFFDDCSVVLLVRTFICLYGLRKDRLTIGYTPMLLNKQLKYKL